MRRGTPLLPFALGAGHERGLRPGTENVVLAMGVSPAEALGTVRLPLGRQTTAGEVERAAAALGRAWRTSGR